MSLYGQYILEREGKHIVEDERGFATYSYLEDCVYIEDIYVLPEFRKSGAASKYADFIASEAKLKGYKTILGSVSPRAKNCTSSVSVLLAYGFKLSNCDSNLVYFSKEI